MKRITKKNQIIVTALALMIAVAGYLNFTYGTKEKDLAAMAEQSNLTAGKAKEAVSEAAAKLTEEEILTDTEAKEELGDETAGETVLTGSESVDVSHAAALRMDREQTRAANKATLLEIVNNTALSEDEKKAAVDALAEMTSVSEREAACELMLQSKGFAEAIVSISGDGADVILNAGELTDAQRAQIEDVVNRKGGVEPDQIVISTMDM